jgi:hypothetical protein
MTDEITKNMSDSEKLNFLINAVSDINRRLTALEQLVHERLHDTRPLWHEVLQKLDAQQQQLDRLEQGQRRIEQKIALVYQDNLELRPDVVMLSKRVDTLENAA